MSARDDLGPTMEPRWKVYATARELSTLADLAMELSAKGPREDLPRARATLDRMRAVLGDSSGP